MFVPTPIPVAQLLNQLEWRYATKVFDSSKKIAADTWSALEKALVLTASSYGLQPWKFIVVTDPDLKAALRPHCWGQAQVTDCSHFVVFASKLSIDTEYVDRFVAATAATRGIPVESIAAYRDMMVGDIVKGARSNVVAEWSARQAYIALGNFMTAAALLGVDTCPMEGFIPVEVDKILGLAEQGLTAAVTCPAGYRSADDKYAHLAKVRYPVAELVETR